MSSVGKFLVLNGQNHTLRTSGGAGRYCDQLFKRFARFENSDVLNGVEYCPQNFPGEDSGNIRQKTDDSKIEILKKICHRCCPPIIFDQLQRLYNYKTFATNSLREIPPQNNISWQHINSKVVLHELTNYGMIDEIGRISLSSNLILVVTFLDIQDYYYPEYFSDATLSRRRLIYSYYKDRAEIFFAISEFTKKTMIDKLNIAPEKIIVTHLAADDMLIINPSENVTEWVKHFGRYLIYPARVWKHKNHDFLLKALSRRKNKFIDEGVKLVLTCGFNKNETNRLEHLVREYSLENIVVILGFVTDEQLQALLSGAEYLVFPSMFEGFGMPILEAMTLGCPVLSSNAGSLPEIGGKAALYFDPQCEDEFIALLDSILTSTEIDREKMIKDGFDNCRNFSWDKTFRDTVDVYQILFN